MASQSCDRYQQRLLQEGFIGSEKEGAVHHGEDGMAAEVLAACSLLGRSKSRGRGCLNSAGFQPVYSVGNPSLWKAVPHIQSIPDPSIILEEASWLHPKMCLINALGHLVIRINRHKPVLHDSLQGRKPGEQVDSGDHCLRH